MVLEQQGAKRRLEPVQVIESIRHGWTQNILWQLHPQAVFVEKSQRRQLAQARGICKVWQISRHSGDIEIRQFSLLALHRASGLQEVHHIQERDG
jgi:hypothetical protein